MNTVMASKLKALGFNSLLEFYQDGGAESDVLPKAEREWLQIVSGRDEGANQDLWMYYLKQEGYEGALPSMQYQRATLI